MCNIYTRTLESLKRMVLTCLNLPKRLLRLLSFTETSDGSCFIDVRAITFLVLLALLTGSLVFLVGFFLSQEIQNVLPVLSKGYLQTLPVFCEDLSLSPDEDVETFDDRRRSFTIFLNNHGKYICENKNITSVVSNVVERQKRLRLAKGVEEKQYLSCGKEKLARKSGHLTVYLSKISNQQKYLVHGTEVKIQWENTLKHSYVDPAIPYHDGEITIPEGRMYFVYASAHLNISRRQDKNFVERRRFILRICRTVNDYEQTILGTTKQFSSVETSITSSLNVASYILLNRGDIIYVKLSDADLLIRGSSGNTFGLYPM